jgi:hypothetical protein
MTIGSFIFQEITLVIPATFQTIPLEIPTLPPCIDFAAWAENSGTLAPHP